MIVKVGTLKKEKNQAISQINKIDRQANKQAQLENNGRETFATWETNKEEQYCLQIPLPVYKKIVFTFQVLD